MQIITVLSAVALLSTTVVAAPQQDSVKAAKRHWFQGRDHGSHKHNSHKHKSVSHHYGAVPSDPTTFPTMRPTGYNTYYPSGTGTGTAAGTGSATGTGSSFPTSYPTSYSTGCPSIDPKTVYMTVNSTQTITVTATPRHQHSWHPSGTGGGPWSYPIRPTGLSQSAPLSSSTSSHSASTTCSFISATTLPPSASITGTGQAFPTTSLVPTTTLSGTNAPSGTPVPHALLCGVHGYPVGDFFMGHIVEEQATVAVTLAYCYRYCAGLNVIDGSCQSFDFYHEPGTDAPRCDFYSGSVAQSLDRIIPVENTWYDLGCTIPK